MDLSMRERSDYSWESFEVGIVVSRQNGKGSLLEARELASLYLLDEELCIHSAHLFDTSIVAFNRILQLIENTPELDAMVQRVSRSHGDEGIEVKRDGRLRQLRFRTRTKGGGRGFTADTVIFDEAMYLNDLAMGAMLPTLSAVPNPQVWYTGSAGDKDSTQLGAVRARAIAGGDPRLTYCEWSIDPCGEFCPDDCEDHDSTGFKEDPLMTGAERQRQMDRIVVSYRKANPAVGIRLAVEHCEAERRSMSAETFERERLGVGDWPVVGEAWRIIDKESWMNALDETSAPDQGKLVIAIDTTRDRLYTCITVAGYTHDIDGNEKVHIEITGDEIGLDHRSGTKWVVPRLKEIMKRNKPMCIVIDKSQQSGTFVDALELAGFEILSPNAREYAQACGEFGSGIVPTRNSPATIQHRGQVPLTNAVAAAEKRELADLWAWSKRGAAVDISPLVSATLATWGLKKKTYEPSTPAPWAMWV